MATKYILAVNHTRFVEYVDTHGVATSGYVPSATKFDNDTRLLQVIAAVLRHHPRATVIIVPVEE